MDTRSIIALSAMKILLEKDFKNLAYSASRDYKTSILEYVADQSFLMADEMIKRSKIASSFSEEKLK